MSSVLVVMAHFDVDARLRAHTLRSIENYAGYAERVVIVSTSGADAESIATLPKNVEFLTRDNFGYDFFSYKWGLDVVSDYADFSRVLIVNDSFVGPTVAIGDILESPQAEQSDLMGMTLSASHGEHAQSFFFTVNQQVAKSRAFRAFWKDMVPVSDRTKVISGYEVGLSKAIRQAGFRVGSYLRPTADEVDLARRRFRHQSQVRLDLRRPDKLVGEVHVWDDAQLAKFNPAVALADRILMNDRLPLMKFDTLRYDPYELGAPDLLRMCEAAIPEQFAGVAQFLRETRLRYPFRKGETNIPVTSRQLRDLRIGYCMDEFFDQEVAVS